MTVTAKTPETLPTRARRAMASAYVQHALSPDAAVVLRVILHLADMALGDLVAYRSVPNGGYRQRFVGILGVRVTAGSLGVQGLAFDRALRQLGDVYAVWFRTGEDTSAREDEASFLDYGNSRHLVTADNWRD